MKYAEFSISSDRVVVSMPSDADIEELLKGLRELGIEAEEELRGLCG